MNTVLLSTAYLAPVEYYAKLYCYDRARVEQYDHYAKQTYRNRCTIAAPDGPLALTVPTVKPDTPKEARHAEMFHEGHPHLRPRQLASPALERPRIGLQSHAVLRILQRRVSPVLRA